MRETFVPANGRRVHLERRQLPAKPAVERTSDPVRAETRSASLRGIVGRLRRLQVWDREPHRFHEEKDELCRDVERLAREIEDEARGTRQCGSRR